MGQPVGRVVLNVVKVEHDVDRDGKDQDEEGQDVDVDGESLRGHVPGEELDPGEQGQRHHGEDLGDLGRAEPEEERYTLEIAFLFYLTEEIIS